MIKNRKNFSLFLIVLLLSGFFITSWLSYQVAVHSIDNYISTDSMPLTSDNIYSEIQHDLFKPILISSLMAQDTFVRDWKLNGEHNPDQLIRFLSEIKNKYNTTTSYFVSDESYRYFHPNGIIKHVSAVDPKDNWYFSLKNTSANQQYEIKIDRDTVSPKNIAIFVNYKVYDYNHNFIGATGVGLSLKTVNHLIERYQKDYQRTVYFIDGSGDVALHGDNFGEKLTLNERIQSEPVTQLVLDSEFYEGSYHRAGTKVFFNSRFIDELNWHLIVEQDVYDSENELTEAFIINILLSLVVTFVVVFIAHITFSDYQKKLIKMASTDKLSGLLNRQAFEPILLKSIGRSKSKNRPLSLILMDIDHFKKVNDTYGHLEGDNVIQLVSNICKSHMGEYDAICRWGGEEFIIMLPDSTVKHANQMALSIKNSLLELDIKPNVTMSFGITEYKTNEMLDNFLHRADSTLYQAKEHGRNRIEIN